MAKDKKETKKGKQASKKLQKILIHPLVFQNNIEAENIFEFGGLPDRNLKKNLGCG